MDHADRSATLQSWVDSSDAYIAFQDAGDRSRTELLDPIMLRLAGDVRGERVLDLGCGEGRFCRMLGERGADTVGIDPIERMIEIARSRDAHGGAYVRAAAETLPFGDASFDLVVSYVTLVDIVGFREAIAECARVLAPGGRMIVANLSFVSAAPVWTRDANGKKLYREISDYLGEYQQVLEWAGMRIINWHRPLERYMQAYLGAGLVLRDFLEPAPDDPSLRDDPWWEDEFRVPSFTAMRWQKPG